MSPSRCLDVKKPDGHSGHRVSRFFDREDCYRCGGWCISYPTHAPPRSPSPSLSTQIIRNTFVRERTLRMKHNKTGSSAARSPRPPSLCHLQPDHAQEKVISLLLVFEHRLCALSWRRAWTDPTVTVHSSDGLQAGISGARIVFCGSRGTGT